MNAAVFKPLLDWWTSELQYSNRHNSGEYQRDRRSKRLESRCPKTPKNVALFFAWNLLRLYVRAERTRERSRINQQNRRDKKGPEINAALRNSYPKKREKLLAIRREKYPGTRAAVNEARRLTYAKNPEKVLLRNQAWRDREGKGQQRLRLVRALRSRQRNALNGNLKSASTMALLGCSAEDYQKHLESQFSQRPGASWETYGFWEIDHIRPCADFDLSDPAQQKICFHYTNLQVLWKIENKMKGDKWPLE